MQHLYRCECGLAFDALALITSADRVQEELQARRAVRSNAHCLSSGGVTISNSPALSHPVPAAGGGGQGGGADRGPEGGGGGGQAAGGRAGPG